MLVDKSIYFDPLIFRNRGKQLSDEMFTNGSKKQKKITRFKAQVNTINRTEKNSYLQATYWIFIRFGIAVCLLLQINQKGTDYLSGTNFSSISLWQHIKSKSIECFVPLRSLQSI